MLRRSLSRLNALMLLFAPLPLCVFALLLVLTSPAERLADWSSVGGDKACTRYSPAEANQPLERLVTPSWRGHTTPAMRGAETARRSNARRS